MNRLFNSILSACLLLILSACGPKVISSGNTPENLRKIGLLPAESKTQISRERIDILQNSLFKNLASKGYQIVDLSEYCSVKNCQDFQAIDKFANPDALIKLEVSSSNSANILAGHYYSISGRLDLISNTNQILVSIEHTESDKGGLLFNSGQLLEGLRSTANSLEEDFFPNLADKFAKNIITKLPSAKGQIENSEVVIENNKLNIIGPGQFSICVDSPQANSVNARIGSSDYPMRKTSDKTFCAAYLIDAEASGSKSIQITASNLYGQNKTITINNPLLNRCNGSELVKIKDNYLEIQSSSECKDLSFSIYSADMSSGPFITRQKSVRTATKVKLDKTSPAIISVIATTDKLATPQQIIFK